MANPARQAIAEFAAARPELEQLTEQWVQRVTALLDEAGINYLSVTGRTKSVGSFAAKARRHSFTDPATQITDQVGVRVITYVASDVVAVAELFADQFRILDDRDLGRETAGEGRFGYASRHLLLSEDAQAEGYVAAQCVSIQLRTVLQHAWAEFEHDIRYKGSVPSELAADLDRRFTLAAGLIELADSEFSTIRDQLQSRLEAESELASASDESRIEFAQLTPFLAGRYSTAGWSRNDRYEWISGLLVELGITSIDELSELLQGIDSDAVTQRMGYRYPPGAVRRLDDDLLDHFGQGYLDLPGNAHRRDALAARLSKLRRTD